MSVEGISKELTDIINVTVEGATLVLADAEERALAGERIAALGITLAEISGHDLQSLINEGSEARLQESIKKFTEVSDGVHALGINDEATTEVCGQLSLARGYNDHRGTRNNGLYAALAARRTSTAQLTIAQEHINEAVKALRVAGQNNAKAEGHINTSVVYSGNALDGIYAYAEKIGAQGLPPHPDVAKQGTTAA